MLFFGGEKNPLFFILGERRAPPFKKERPETDGNKIKGGPPKEREKWFVWPHWEA